MVRSISAPKREYWLETTDQTDEKYKVLEARADRIDGIEEYDLDSDIAYFEASPGGFRDLVYARIDTDHGEHPVRTLFGKQYTEVEMEQFERSNDETEKPVKVAADGGKPQNRDLMKDVSHESPLDGVQESLERG